MFYYEVAVGLKTRANRAIFTYESSDEIAIGTIVSVSVRAKKYLGFIVKISAKPAYKTSRLDKLIIDLHIPPESVTAYRRLCDLFPFAESELAMLFLPPSLPTPEDAGNLTQKPKKPLEIPPLNKEQQRVFKTLHNSPSNMLLRGDTGTGKTRIYAHLIERYLLDHNMFVLAPEIGLSRFIYEELCPYFPNALLYHSGLTRKERRTVWLQSMGAKKGLLIVGPRSALGLPLANIGPIIIDEAHDQSYRQDSHPYISARRIAVERASTHHTTCIYGTATPDIVDYYVASRDGRNLVEIDTPAVENKTATIISVASYEDEREKQPRSSFLKSSLQALKRTIDSGGQAMVLINRRGTARYILCETCGHEQRCKRCDHLVVYHHDNYELKCHFCGAHYAVPHECSSCGSYEIKMRSFGSKAVVEELTKLFPESRIKRFDRDTHKKDHLSLHIPELVRGDIDIIVGTQMLAKGFDLPKLKTLVIMGFNSAGSLHSSERDFQLLYQIIGRAKRGHQNTEIVIQTSNPDYPVIDYAVKRDYAGFYTAELAERKMFNYPPFRYLMIVHIKKRSSQAAKRSAEKAQALLLSFGAKIEVGEPLPNITERTGADYHWHILVRATKRKSLVELAKLLGMSYVCELDPVDTP